MKRKYITFWRIIHTGIVNLIRNFWLAIAAIAVMVVTLTIVLLSLITNATFENTIAQITDKISVSVYLQDTVTEAQAQELIKDLEKQPAIARVNYLNKQQALDNYVEQNRAENPTLASATALVGNTIPATIQVYPTDLNEVAKIQAYLTTPDIKKLQTDKSPSYNGTRKEAIDNITHATNILRKIGIVTVTAFTVVCALIIFNTIQMAIFNRRDELTIMRLLGASTSFIRGPFVVESAIYGLLAGFTSFFMINALFLTTKNALQASSLGLLDIQYANDYFGNHFFQLLGLQVGLGILIGTVSSVIATRRYLKFKTK